ncbi:uncharacterized protein LOC111613612 [Centruroides sculpturatus]|uniref:uncharacterized protein LOC111613612 n=1 Tax=Centruroides sculpturatus TaxID=218467 RepID=UPI000C6DF837|nr:uncharacterized protein LOC111613612 [Centruroides sculpturatus]
MFSVSTSHVSKALNVNPLKIKAKGLDSVKSRITNIRDHLNKPLSINQFCEMLLAEVLRDFPSITPYELDPEDKQQIEALRVNKYATWAHNYGQNPHYELNNTLYVSGVGLVEVYLNVENGLISDLKFYGDFFGKKDVAHVENHLRKVRYSRPDILRRLSEIQGFNDYFNNLDPAVLADLVVGLVPQEGVKKI